MKNIKTNYSKIDKFVIKCGLNKTDIDGVYSLNGKLIDLTSSGNEHWQITINIIKELIK